MYWYIFFIPIFWRNFLLFLLEGRLWRCKTVAFSKVVIGQLQQKQRKNGLVSSFGFQFSFYWWLKLFNKISFTSILLTTSKSASSFSVFFFFFFFSPFASIRFVASRLRKTYFIVNNFYSSSTLSLNPVTVFVILSLLFVDNFKLKLKRQQQQQQQLLFFFFFFFFFFFTSVIIICHFSLFSFIYFYLSLCRTRGFVMRLHFGKLE